MTAGGGVDVLAVLERANERLIDSGVPYGALVTATAAIAELIATLESARDLLDAQSSFIENYRCSGKCPKASAEEAVRLLHKRNSLLPNYYNSGRIASAIAALEQQS